MTTRNDEILFELVRDIGRDVKTIESKLDKVSDKQEEQHETLVEQAACLKDHISRTKALEDRIEPIEKQSALISLGVKIVAWIVGSAGSIFGVIKFILHMTKK